MKLCGEYIRIDKSNAGVVVRISKAYEELAHHAEQLYKLCCEVEQRYRAQESDYKQLLKQHTELQLQHERLQAKYDKCSSLCNALVAHTAELETDKQQLQAEIDRLERYYE